MLWGVKSHVAFDGLELRHLDALRAVVEEGTFARAADVLGFTQSAVSQQIGALERIVGERLFDRPGGPRPVRLTPAGRLLLTHARAILDRVEAAGHDLAAFKLGEEGRIEVGVFQSVGVKILPAVVKRLRLATPNAKADVRPFEAHDDQLLISRVTDGELDAAFLGGTGDPAGLNMVELARDPYVVLVPADSPASDPLAIYELGSVPLIGQPEGDSCQLRVDVGLAEAGIATDYVFRTADNAVVQSMVKAGMGYAVMPLLAVDVHDAGIRVCRLEPPIPPRRLQLVWGLDPSPLTERFVAVAVDVCREEMAVLT